MQSRPVSKRRRNEFNSRPVTPTTRIRRAFGKFAKQHSFLRLELRRRACSSKMPSRAFCVLGATFDSPHIWAAIPGPTTTPRLDESSSDRHFEIGRHSETNVCLLSSDRWKFSRSRVRLRGVRSSGWRGRWLAGLRGVQRARMSRCNGSHCLPSSDSAASRIAGCECRCLR